MNIAITGASGFIGSAIAKHACEHGHTVTALVRETSNRSHINPLVKEFVVGTHDDASAVASLVEKADVVIHNSFDWEALKSGNMQMHFDSNLTGSINLLESSADRHFIYISSIAVHHHMHDRWEGSIDETHPTRPGSSYGACKAAVESHLWAANASKNQLVTAIRPCAVYGIDPNKERSIGSPIIATIKEGKPYTRLGGGKFVHVDDVAAATIASIDNPKSSPNVYNLVDCYARWADWALIAAEELECVVEIDQSSPIEPKNHFITTNVSNDLGIVLNRGMDGIRKHLKDLINV